jgi:hypothetical protein
MSDSISIWLYTRARESIRVVVDGTKVVVFGPGDDETTQVCDTEDEALVQQKLIEQRLILRGWTFDRLITERRSGRDRRDGPREGERRRENPAPKIN